MDKFLDFLFGRKKEVDPKQGRYDALVKQFDLEDRIEAKIKEARDGS